MAALRVALLAALLAALLGSAVRPAPVRAQSGSAIDLINAVNAYRAQYGLEAYNVDGGLMSLAQSHSEYQASIQTCTHQRSDGSGPGDVGISAENIACGRNLSVSDAIYYQWADNLHLATMLGPTSGSVGAGVASSGDTVYYTLAVKRGSGEFVFNPPAANPPGNAAAQDQPTQPPVSSSGILPSTPNPDGSIVHIIRYGETLISIAETYGISLADLIGQNRLDPNNPVYFEGDRLIIRLAFTETPFITATFTPRPPTRTPMPSRTPRPTRTPAPELSPLPTWTDTPEPLIQVPTLEDLGPARPVLAYSFIAISALGLIVLLFTAFWPGRKE